MTVKYSGMLTKRRDLGEFRPSEGGRLRRRWDLCEGQRLSTGAHSAGGRGYLRRRGRKALAGTEVQRFTEQSKRELPSPLGTRLLDAGLVGVVP